MAEHEIITDNDLALFRERAKTELKSTGDIGRLAWDDVVEALCKEVARLRSVSKRPGNEAEIRKALEAFVESVGWLCEGDEMGILKRQFGPLLSVARAVLAANP